MTSAVLGAQPRAATVGDFFALLKPRVMSLVVFTGLAGIVVAPGHVHPMAAFTALFAWLLMLRFATLRADARLRVAARELGFLQAEAGDL